MNEEIETQDETFVRLAVKAGFTKKQAKFLRKICFDVPKSREKIAEDKSK